jgi:hypothetical protein
MLWSTNQGATLIGDVTYRRHEQKIGYRNLLEFADTVLRDSRFEIQGSKFEARFQVQEVGVEVLVRDGVKNG